MAGAKIITEITPQQRQSRIKRVCAYARVSTGHEEQKMSFEAQKDYYTRMLSAKPGVIFTGIYADEGISGLKASRPGFKEMMNDARNGRIDEIYTKSISRFARNTVLFLQAITELRACGVKVFFEKEKIDSMSSECDLLMSIYAIVAEDERKQVCSNVQWSIRNKYASGNPALNPCRVYGYKEGAGGLWEPDAAQAETVRYIFSRYLDGVIPREIAEELNSKGIPADSGECSTWKAQRVLRIIRNEKYKGDCLMQKQFVNESGKQVPNRGELSQYYIENHHAAIVLRDIWEKANTLADSRKPKVYPFSGRLHCPRCGAAMRHCTHSYGDTWQCSSYYDNGRSACAGLWIKDKTIMKISTPAHMSGHWTITEEVSDGKKQYRLIPFDAEK